MCDDSRARFSQDDYRPILEADFCRNTSLVHCAIVTATTTNHHHCHRQTKMTIDSIHRHASDSIDPSFDAVDFQCGMPQSHSGSMGHHCSRVELVTTVVVDHRSTNPITDQARCFQYAPLRDMERSSTASASEVKVGRFDLNFPSYQQVRAIAHSAPALQRDDSVHLFDSTNLALASDHQAKTFHSTTLVVVAEDRYQLNMHLVIITTELHRSFSRIVETVAPLPTVDAMSVTVVRMTVARQSLNRAYSVSHQKKLRRHKLKGP